MTPPSETKSTSLVWLAYLAAFAGVVGHASSEFFVKLSGLQGAEISVWRFMLGGAALVVVALEHEHGDKAIERTPPGPPSRGNAILI